MIELLMGSVQNWECDIMGHMNVRHYLTRCRAALGALGIELGVGPAELRARGLRWRPRDQHIRFAREMPPGTPFTIRGGVVARGGAEFRVYLEIHNSATESVATTLVQDVALVGDGGLPTGIAARAERLMVTVPDYAAARGLSLTTRGDPLPMERALALGLRRIHRGAVTPEDADTNGLMRSESVVARIWDGLPHLAERPQPNVDGKRLGGAALEQRFVYRAAARLGDIVEIRSGLRAVGGKTSEWCHFLYNAETGELIASAAVVGVAFDLATRKSVTLDEDTLRRLQAQVVPGLAV
ncbi:MAG: acyl-[acyl-carrier-protein] thioesterase [Alphaproteobacteria bacterium]|nr:acyl-[acyl-carrier-protein] thioesterase [Alphaproteobacteria bacterium]